MEKTNKNNRYLPETAGRKMVANVPTALPEEKILDIRQRIFDKAQEFEGPKSPKRCQEPFRDIITVWGEYCV